jgi:hypothetical protein
VQKGGAGDPTGTLKATYDVVAEAEVGVPSSKISASLAHSGLVKGMKATLSGNPQDVKTAKLALQYLYGAVGVKADITELTAGAPKADINLCWADGDHAAGVSGITLDKSFDPAALPKKLSWSVQSTGVVPDSTVALALSDAFDTVKASVVTKVRQTNAFIFIRVVEFANSNPPLSQTPADRVSPTSTHRSIRTPPPARRLCTSAPRAPPPAHSASPSVSRRLAPERLS